MSQIALVTGAGSGVGRAVALGLASAGQRVHLVGRTRDTLDDTARAIDTGGAPPARVHVADVANPEAITAVFARLEDEDGRLDFLFNNAGTSAAAAPIDEIPLASLRQVLDVNLWGALVVARAAFGLMRRQRPRGGRIVNNGSISAHTPRPGSVPYTVSKHGITGLTRTLALDGRDHDIACGQIDIGNADTAMTERMRAGIVQADGSTRVEPTMDPRHVADAVTYMAGLPLDANVLFMTVMARDMPYVGRG